MLGVQQRRVAQFSPEESPPSTGCFLAPPAAAGGRGTGGKVIRSQQTAALCHAAAAAAAASSAGIPAEIFGVEEGQIVPARYSARSPSPFSEPHLDANRGALRVAQFGEPGCEPRPSCKARTLPILPSSTSAAFALPHPKPDDRRMCALPSCLEGGKGVSPPRPSSSRGSRVVMRLGGKVHPCQVLQHDVLSSPLRYDGAQDHGDVSVKRQPTARASSIPHNSEPPTGGPSSPYPCGLGCFSHFGAGYEGLSRADTHAPVSRITCTDPCGDAPAGTCSTSSSRSCFGAFASPASAVAFESRAISSFRLQIETASFDPPSACPASLASEDAATRAPCGSELLAAACRRLAAYHGGGFVGCSSLQGVSDGGFGGRPGCALPIVDADVDADVDTNVDADGDADFDAHVHATALGHYSPQGAMSPVSWSGQLEEDEQTDPRDGIESFWEKKAITDERCLHERGGVAGSFWEKAEMISGRSPPPALSSLSPDIQQQWRGMSVDRHQHSHLHCNNRNRHFFRRSTLGRSQMEREAAGCLPADSQGGANWRSPKQMEESLFHTPTQRPPPAQLDSSYSHCCSCSCRNSNQGEHPRLMGSPPGQSDIAAAPDFRQHQSGHADRGLVATACCKNATLAADAATAAASAASAAAAASASSAPTSPAHLQQSSGHDSRHRLAQSQRHHHLRLCLPRAYSPYSCYSSSSSSNSPCSTADSPHPTTDSGLSGGLNQEMEMEPHGYLLNQQQGTLKEPGLSVAGQAPARRSSFSGRRSQARGIFGNSEAANPVRSRTHPHQGSSDRPHMSVARPGGGGEDGTTELGRSQTCPNAGGPFTGARETTEFCSRRSLREDLAAIDLEDSDSDDEGTCSSFMGSRRSLDCQRQQQQQQRQRQHAQMAFLCNAASPQKWGQANPGVKSTATDRFHGGGISHQGQCEMQHGHEPSSPALADASAQETAAPEEAAPARGGRKSSSPTALFSKTFTLDQLAAATNNWAADRVLGSGSFGSVYRGTLMGCQVAVKRLDGSSGGESGKQGAVEYATEVDVLSRMRHPNIVLLMGHCPESHCLVYEYLSGGSLQDYLGSTLKKPRATGSSLLLAKPAAAAGRAVDAAHPNATAPGMDGFFDKNPPPKCSLLHDGSHNAGNTSSSSSSSRSSCNLNCRKALAPAVRVRILTQIASGLVYLHRNSPPIVHRDLKPANVLLDADLKCKLGDVGLARLVEDPDDARTFRISGTVGYIDPEAMSTFKIAPSIDIYAFGMIVLQLITGEAAVTVLRRFLDEQTGSMPATPSQRWMDLAVQAVFLRLDESGGAWGHEEMVKELIRLGLLCVSRSSQARPSLCDQVLPFLLQASQSMASM